MFYRKTFSKMLQKIFANVLHILQCFRHVEHMLKIGGGYTQNKALGKHL